MIWGSIFNDVYLSSVAQTFARSRANARSGTGQKARDRRWMDTKQAGCVSSRLPSSGDHPNNFSLLLMIQLRRPSANPPFAAGGLQAPGSGPEARAG